jgi:hypothetical protein
MNIQDMIEFLILCRDKVDIATGKVAVKDPLIEISAMLDAKIGELEEQTQALRTQAKASGH